LIRYLQLYYYFLIQRLKVLVEYRGSFLIGALSTVFSQTAGLVTIWVVMRQVHELNGWNYYQILLVYGLINLAKSLNHMFADNLWTFGVQYVRTGYFDCILVRPINPLFHLLAERFCHDGIGEFLIGVALVAIALTALHIQITLLLLLYLAVAVASGGLIFISLNLIVCVTAFWVRDSQPIMKTIFGIHEFAKYPITIYSPFFIVLLTWILPYAFSSYYPAYHLLGNADLSGWLPPIVALVFAGISYSAWRFGLRHYESAGS
jgi:viologen exporter family transport system permease protein